ncbi:MAG: hypothetical protein Fur0037_21750 [Planctomycetota bacterium]
MSLFGTGRKEGFLCVLVLALLVFAAYALGGCLQHGLARSLSSGWSDPDRSGLLEAMREAGSALRSGDLPLWSGPAMRAGEPMWSRGAPLLYPPWWLLALGPAFWAQILAALHAAIASATFYRFLRAYGRSRYASFLGGGSYGLSAWLLAAMATLPQAAAAAWLPLQLEAVVRTTTPGKYRRGTAMLPFALALPFATGGTILATIGLLVALSMLFGLQRRMLSHERPRVRARTGFALVLAAMLTAPEWLAFAQLGVGASHFEPPRIPGLWTEAQPIAWISELGVLALVLLPLALLRSQPRARIWPWLVSTLGAAAAIALLAGGRLVLDLPAPLPDALWNASLWLCTTGVLVLATASLDDFLGSPQRRPWSLYAVPAASIAAVSCLALLRPEWFSRLMETPGPWVAALATVLAAVLLPFWRALGVLRWKQAFALVALSAGAGSTVLAIRAPAPESPETAAPAAETWSRIPRYSDIAPRIRFDFVAEPDLERPYLRVVPGLPAGFVARPTQKASFRAEHPRGTDRRYEVDMADGQGLLVVGDALGPGWRAWLDGSPTEILWLYPDTAAIAVPPGRHEVRCEFRPLLWSLGVPLALCGAVLAAIWFLLSLEEPRGSSAPRSRGSTRNASASPASAIAAMPRKVTPPPRT